ELTRYLSDNWAPIIEKDVDGPSSLPLKIDAEQPNLGKLHATRRVARTIYLASAPTAAAAHRGLEARRVKLGCVRPREPPAVVRVPDGRPDRKEPGNAAETAARAILASRGNVPRLYRNSLVFLAADKVRLQDLDEAVRRFLAWKSILGEKETLNLDPHQVRQA